jgi:hypothetical protein
MDPRLAVALYIYSFVALGYVIIAWWLEKIKIGRAKH